MYEEYELYVRCPQCGERHTATEVKLENIEEDIEGRDVGYFTCPVTNQPTHSLIYTR